MRVMICTPSLNSQVTTGFAHSMIETMTMLSMIDGINAQWNTLAGCNFLHFARNKMVLDFLDSNATDLLFIDDDMQWSAEDIVAMLIKHDDKDIIGGICPISECDWNTRLIGDSDGSLFGCYYVGTGIMRIKRSAFDRFNGPPYFDTDYKDNRMVGEDAWFCRKVRANGGRIWAMPIGVTHRGITLKKDQVRRYAVSYQEKVSA